MAQQPDEVLPPEKPGPLAVLEGRHSPAVIAPLAPMPAFSGAEMAKAVQAYRELQQALDRSMPDQIMELDGKKFRKKGYWRALAVAFNLTVEPVPGSERREVSGDFDDGRPNFGYIVTYRASTAGGRSVEGDGACFAIEKAPRFKCPHDKNQGRGKFWALHYPASVCPDFDPSFQWKSLPAQSTEHNIRSHAHTRAFNRAVSNLVGFGEVSADELPPDGPERDAAIHAQPGDKNAPPPGAVDLPYERDSADNPPASTRPAAPPTSGQHRPNATTYISGPQWGRLQAIGRKSGYTLNEIEAEVQRRGYTIPEGAETYNVPRGKPYDDLCAWAAAPVV